MQFTESSTKHMKYLLDQFSRSIDKKINKKTKKEQNITDKFFTDFYKNLDKTSKQVKKIKQNPKIFSSKITNIKIPAQIPKSSLFVSGFVSHTIKKYIEDNSIYDLCFTFLINKKKYTVHFVLMDEEELLLPEKYEIYIERVMTWLIMAEQYKTGTCSKNSLTVYFYLTPFEKTLPECSITLIGPEHINSGVAYACSENGEIMIFRKEEWFKVFIHETCHTYGLDFSTMSQELLNKNIKKIFPVESEVNLFEAYTECWARIINSLFISYYTLERNNKLKNEKNGKTISGKDVSGKGDHDPDKNIEEFILTTE